MFEEGIIILGGGGHSASVISILRRINDSINIAIVAKEKTVDAFFNDIPLIGSDKDLERLRAHYRFAFIGIGSEGKTKKREELFQLLINLEYTLPNIIDPSAIVSPFAALKRGVFVGAHAYIGPFSTIGDGCIINTSAVVEHHCELSKFVHVAPASTCCGSVKIGHGTHIGAGAIIRQNLTIGDKCVIGMGAVVTKSVSKNTIAFGNPCCIVSTNNENEKKR
jgi:sugar O-acyltransferase (sialic acid O-acetyltransferase NeuD family)